jgi:hypothetical protein
MFKVKSKTFGQRIWNKVWYYHKHIENLWRTWGIMGQQNEYLCDLDGSIWNRMGTQNSKKSHDPSPSPLLPQGKQYWASWVHVASLHWLPGISISLYHSSVMSHVWTQVFLGPLDHFFFLNLEFCDVANVAILNKMI